MTKTTLKDRVELFDAIFKTPSNKRRPIFEAYAEKHGLKLESVRVMYSKMLNDSRPAVQEKKALAIKAKEVEANSTAMEALDKDGEKLFSWALEILRKLIDTPVGKYQPKFPDIVRAAKVILDAAELRFKLSGAIQPGTTTINILSISKDPVRLKELLALWETDEDAQRALWSWIEPRARVRGWR